jgi:peptidoglycan L-alanyl-D-glutamate endopeptidase CwlK
MAEKDNNLLFFGLAAAAAAAFAVSQSETVKTIVSDTVTDVLNNARINKMHPLARQPARNFINAAEKKGIQLRVTDTLRTFLEQANLYAIGCSCCSCGIGRTKPGSIVTNAKPGESYHNYGLALDVVEIKNGILIGIVICSVCNSIGYKPDYPLARWKEIGALGKSFGFEWGGDWITFRDLPHFQITFGYTVTQLMAKYNAGQRVGDYVNI